MQSLTNAMQTAKTAYSLARRKPHTPGLDAPEPRVLCWRPYLLQVTDEWVSVILPVALQCLFRWKLLTAELHGDLKAVAAEVIEVLHSCQNTKYRQSKCAHSDRRVQVLLLHWALTPGEGSQVVLWGLPPTGDRLHIVAITTPGAQAPKAPRNRFT